MAISLHTVSRVAFATFLALTAWFSHVLPSTAANLSNSKIRELVEPIALYPDPLLQQILPAATFPDQIADAALLIRSKKDAELIKSQNWDNSVKVVATYSGILKMMYDKLDWTTELGNAFLNQHEDILNEIQGLRSKAKSLGNLRTSSQQNVKTQTTSGGDTVITIEPSNPQVVYVPQPSTTVYTETSSSSSNLLAPIASFGLGLALGSALNDDDDHYYYGGPWGGPMWYGDYDNSWADVRRDRNEDIYDLAKDRQDFKQDQRSDRQDFRQDWAKDHPDQINRENAQKARQNFQNNLGTRDQKRNEAKASMQSRTGTADWSRSAVAANRPTRSGTSSWSGQGGGSYASRASNRGSYSRSSGGSFQGGGGFRGGGGRRGGGR